MFGLSKAEKRTKRISEIDALLVNLDAESDEAKALQAEKETLTADSTADDERGECIQEWHDQLNQLVHLHKKGDKYRVVKDATGFSSKWVSEEKAREIFEQKVAAIE